MSPHDHDASAQHPSPAEWVVGGIGALLAIALSVLFVHQATLRGDGADLQARVASTEQTAAGFAVTVEVRNSGGRTAESVHVSGSVAADGQTIASGQATVDYLPPDSKRETTLVFSADPRAPGHALTVTVDGYSGP